MQRILLALLLLTLAVPLPSALGAVKNSAKPAVAGTTKGNTGCAILAKGMPPKGKLLFIGVIYVRTQYTVLETFNAKLPHQKYTGQGGVNKLNQYAVNHRIKLVVIPSKHTAEQMDEARKMCKGQ
ncbi:MAG: hypothetical protein ACRD1N_08215 [Terriglobia bacterium]